MPRFETFLEFLERTNDLPPMSWLIDGLVPTVGQVWVIAAPGSGKTWCSFAIAKTAAVDGRDVFVIEEEHSERGLHDRLRNMAFTDECLDRIRLWHRKGLKVGDSKFNALVTAFASADRPVAIFDCLAAVLEGNENETQDASRFVDHMKRLLTSNPQGLVLVLHHVSKGVERAEGNMAMARRGSSAFNGAADIELRQRKVSSPKGSGVVSAMASAYLSPGASLSVANRQATPAGQAIREKSGALPLTRLLRVDVVVRHPVPLEPPADERLEQPRRRDQRDDRQQREDDPEHGGLVFHRARNVRNYLFATAIDLFIQYHAC